MIFVGNKELLFAIKTNNKWYKNCKNVRKRNGKICRVCPFREQIENLEKNLKEKDVNI